MLKHKVFYESSENRTPSRPPFQALTDPNQIQMPHQSETAFHLSDHSTKASDSMPLKLHAIEDWSRKRLVSELGSARFDFDPPVHALRILFFQALFLLSPFGAFPSFANSLLASETWVGFPVLLSKGQDVANARLHCATTFSKKKKMTQPKTWHGTRLLLCWTWIQFLVSCFSKRSMMSQGKHNVSCTTTTFLAGKTELRLD